jgi:type IV fimbrial biogenesis protein FimT
MKKWQAFTLIELMIVLGVAAILATMAAPAFWNMIQNSRTTTQANELVTAINLARSEAIKRGERVEICSTANPAAGECGGDNDWAAGWLVRVDGDASDVIRVWEAPAGLNLAANGTANMVFRSLGERENDGTVTFTLNFDGCTGDRQRRIRVNAAGRPSVTREAC